MSNRRVSSVYLQMSSMCMKMWSSTVLTTEEFHTHWCSGEKSPRVPSKRTKLSICTGWILNVSYKWYLWSRFQILRTASQRQSPDKLSRNFLHMTSPRVIMAPLQDGQSLGRISSMRITATGGPRNQTARSACQCDFWVIWWWCEASLMTAAI